MSMSVDSILSSPSEIVVVEIVTSDSSSKAPTTQIQNDSSSESATTQSQNVADQIRKSSSTGNPNSRKHWRWGFGDRFTAKHKTLEPKLADNNEKTTNPTNTDSNNNGDEEILALSNLINHDMIYVREVSEKLEKYKVLVNLQADELSKKFEKIKESGNQKELWELKKSFQKLKLKIPSLIDSADDPHRNRTSNGFANAKRILDYKVFDKIPKLYNSETFENSPEFEDIQRLYDGLEIELKLCLLCFAVFPENEIIKKRLMVYWWIGEGFVPPILRDETRDEQIASRKTAEDFANEFFHKLIVLGFIQPVQEKRSVIVGICRMHPLIRAAVIRLAEKAKFFNFDANGEPTEDLSNAFRACLMGKGLTNYQDLEKLHMLFNVNEGILEFKPEWFMKMRNVCVLYLGRWQTSATHHIEVEETKFLDGLGNLKHLRFFSLQGVSRITELPSSISELKNLTILDLRACHNLEAIPDGIGSLKSLTHLDVSECYFLDRMPKDLSLLSNLQVLKGFVVGDRQGKSSCTLDDLAKLPRLKKLSIYTGLKEFPAEKHLIALQQLQGLLNLTIAWGGGSSHDKLINNSQSSGQSDGGDKKRGHLSARALPKKQRASGSLTRSVAFKLPALPSQLEKLDLKCFPGTTTPGWLMPASLKSLKKLYIRGGKFSDLGQYQDLDDSGGVVLPVKDTWGVEQLRLKYLSELEMDWRELKELFPNLIYLEKMKCPKLTFFPCDESGVWINKMKLNQMQEAAA